MQISLQLYKRCNLNDRARTRIAHATWVGAAVLEVMLHTGFLACAVIVVWTVRIRRASCCIFWSVIILQTYDYIRKCVLGVRSIGIMRGDTRHCRGIKKIHITSFAQSRTKTFRACTAAIPVTFGVPGLFSESTPRFTGGGSSRHHRNFLCV